MKSFAPTADLLLSRVKMNAFVTRVVSHNIVAFLEQKDQQRARHAHFLPILAPLSHRTHWLLWASLSCDYLCKNTATDAVQVLLFALYDTFIQRTWNSHIFFLGFSALVRLYTSMENFYCILDFRYRNWIDTFWYDNNINHVYVFIKSRSNYLNF